MTDHLAPRKVDVDVWAQRNKLKVLRHNKKICKVQLSSAHGVDARGR